MDELYTRPATPQPMLHRMPDKPDISTEVTKPSKVIVLIVASTAVAGKVQIARSVAAALDCPLFQGDSLHETAAKAASVGPPTHAPSTGQYDALPASGANESRYQRMWLSKMTRTGLLFPDDSRPANSGFAEIGGVSSTSTSRRGSSSSFNSMADESGSSASSIASTGATPPASKTRSYVSKPTATSTGMSRMAHSNTVLMVLTHPILLDWHRRCIRDAVGDYHIGIIFVPLDVDSEPPVLKVLDPRTMTRFTTMEDLSTRRMNGSLDWSEEVVLETDVDADVENIADDVVRGVLRIVKG